MAKRVFKSKKKLSGTRCAYRPWRDWEVGDLVIGKFVSEGVDNYDKPNWVVEVEDAQFADAKAAKKLIGQSIGLNSSGKLDKAMKKVDCGDLIQVSYNGKSEIEGGKYKGKDSHDIEVDLVEEDTGEEDEDDDRDEDEDEDEDL